MTNIDIITLTCPACKKQVDFDAAMAGQQVPCPHEACGAAIHVPEPATFSSFMKYVSARELLHGSDLAGAAVVVEYLLGPACLGFAGYWLGAVYFGHLLLGIVLASAGAILGFLVRKFVAVASMFAGVLGAVGCIIGAGIAWLVGWPIDQASWWGFGITATGVFLFVMVMLIVEKLAEKRARRQMLLDSSTSTEDNLRVVESEK